MSPGPAARWRGPSRHFWGALAIAVPCTILAMAVLSYRYGSLGQTIHMRQVHRFIDAVKSTVRGNRDFSRVSLYTYTMDDGCLLANGYVGSEEILRTLKGVLAACPRPIRWNVEVVSPENLQDYPQADDEDSSSVK